MTYKWDEDIKTEEQAKAAGYDGFKPAGSILDNATIGGKTGENGKTSVYLGYGPNDFSFTHPNSTPTPVDVGIEWLSGEGPRHRDFSDGDLFTEMLKQHYHIQETKEMITLGIWLSDKRRESFSIDMPFTEGKNPYSLGGFDGVSKYIDDYSTLLTGGAKGNLAVTFLGSYGLEWKVLSKDGNTATIQFVVTNSSTMQSASRPPVIGYTKAWQNTIGSRINEEFKSGPGSKVTQTFIWNETISLLK